MVLIFFTSCGELSLDSQLSDGNQLVVNGLITDGDGPYEVSLTRTVPFLGKDSIRTVSNANVFIVDNFEDTAFLEEKEPGVYRTSNQIFTGNIGASYQLFVILEDSSFYQSTEEVLRRGGTLDELDFSPRDDSRPEKNVLGIITSVGGVDHIYRWRIFRNNQLLSTPSDIFLIETNASEDGLSRRTNHSIGHRTFNIGDTVRVEQLSLTEGAFDFYERLIEQTNVTGSSSPVVPAQSIGNIINVNDSTEEVLGFFGASSLDIEEIVIDSN